MTNIDLKRLAVDREYWDEVSAKQSEFALIRDKKVIAWSFDEPDFWGREVIPRPTKQEWEGGLPQVGVECEYLPDPKIKTDWRRCTFIAHVNGEFFVVTDSDSKTVDRMSDLIPASRRFRPLKSQHERQREELCAIASKYSDLGRVIVDDILSKYNLEPKP